MGPQLYRCGNGTIVIYAGTVTRRFNGAATLSLRRRVLTTLRARVVMGFNGAATLSLRKPAPAQGTPPYWVSASMGPQLYRCGNGTWVRRDQYGTPASMGAATLSLRKLPSGRYGIAGSVSFNGAATLSLRKPGRQWKGTPASR